MPQEPLSLPIGGSLSKLNISTPTVVKALPGTCVRVSINTSTAVSAVAGCYDTNATSSVAAANLFASIPASATGEVVLEWPCETGIVVIPGTGANLSVSYD